MQNENNPVVKDINILGSTKTFMFTKPAVQFFKYVCFMSHQKTFIKKNINCRLNYIVFMSIRIQRKC